MGNGENVNQDRRGDATKPDTGQRRRRSDMHERQEEFRLFRDKVLLTIGTIGVVGIAVAAVISGVKDSALAIAALSVFATLLGIPAALRVDERRSSGKTE